MKAIVLEEINKPLKYFRDYPDPTLKEGEVLVKIKNAALNRRDVWIQQGKYPNIKLPCILGSDGAGIVENVGEDTDKNLIGQEVVINPNINWGENPRYQRKDYRILGMPDNGTFAEYVVVKKDRIFPKPSHLTFPEASALPLAGLTAYRATFTRGNLKPGEKVFINGVGGGVAYFALLFAISVGAEVYISSGSQEKIDKAKSLGAINGINYKDKDAFKTLVKSTGGFDLIIDSAGGNGISNLITIAKPGARIVFYGITTGFWQNVNAALAFWKQIDIKGSTMGSDEDFKNMIKLVERNKIKPEVNKIFPLEKTQEAFDFMAQSKQFGKIVLEI